MMMNNIMRIKQVWRPWAATAFVCLHLVHFSGGSLRPSGGAAAAAAGDDAIIPPPPDWAPWSSWSACSRTCDAGLQRRERMCLNVTGGCEGPPLGWRVCSLHPCPPAAPSWRQEQCSRLDSQPRQEDEATSLQTWEAVNESNPTCRLICRAQNGGNAPPLTRNEAAEDGTRCGTGSLAVCVAGRCEAVGCDLEVSSGRTLDRCGVCGGNGTSCGGGGGAGGAEEGGAWRYRWERVRLSRCSASCGGGTRMVRHVCRDGRTGEEAAAGLCATRDKPKVQLDACNTDPCPPRWEVSEWTRCTSECTGLRTRTVQCLSDVQSARIQVDEDKCPGEKPQETEPCSAPSCPAWTTSHWSQCSKDCGEGTQEREVECKTSTGERRTDCPGVRPPGVQLCHGACLSPEPSGGGSRVGQLEAELERLQERQSDEEEEEEEEGEEPEHQEAAVKQGEGVAGLKSSGLLDKEEDEEEEDEEEVRPPWGQRISHLRHIEERRLAKTYPSFLVGEWNPCSVTCGEGIRWRRVECKILLEFSGTVATLPDRDCPGVKPAETEICVQSPSCGRSLDTTFHSQNLPQEPPLLLPLQQEQQQQEEQQHLMQEQQEQPYQEPAYAWKITGYTDCTASCLGGLQESIVTCVDSLKEVAVAPYFCDPNARLDIEVRACNEKPCPPRWNVSDFSSCSRSCGGGNQNRTVHCIQEVAHGDRNVITRPGAECPQPPPRAQQFCNVIDCPVDWDIGPWTKCSARCGTGRRYRKVRCRQVLSLGQAIDRAERECSATQRPLGEEPCTATDCSQPQLPAIRESKGQNYVQSDPQQRLVKLKVGGRAKVFRGTSIKIRCPVKHFAKTEILWALGDQLYSGRKKRTRHAKISVSRKGILKIKDIDYKEAGRYTCLASKIKADIDISLMEPEEELRRRPPTSDERLLKGGSDLWLPLPPEEMPPNDFTAVTETEGEKKKSSRVRENEVMMVDTAGRITTSSKQASMDQRKAKRKEEEEKEKRMRTKKEQDEEEEDDYTYWDRIDNHVAGGSGDQKLTRKKAPDPAAGGAVHSQISVWLLACALLLQVYQHIRHSEKRRKGGKHSKAKASTQGPPPLSWSAGPWSACSQPCRGHQSRSLFCRMAFTERADTQTVPDSFCVSAEVERPRAVRPCGDECPAWEHSDWGPCSKAECIARNTAMQSRRVDCIQGGRVVDDTQCKGQTTPVTTQTCRAEECVAIWVLGDWSQCSETCGVSERRRTVSCEWLRGGLATNADCDAEETRPSARMKCVGPPCPGPPAWGTLPVIQVAGARGGRHVASGDGDPFCEDTSKFCSLAKSHGLCSTEKYREQCCRTCTRG